MIKKAIAIAAMGAMAFAGNALAQIDVNIYGASAQATFWKSAAETFLTTSCGCTGITKQLDKKDGYIKGTGCTSYDTDLVIRYTSKASWDGVYAASNAALTSTPAPTNDCSGNMRQRMMYTDENGVKSCQTVHVGASDVAGDAFVQESHGYLYEVNDDDDWVNSPWEDRTFNGIDVTGLEVFEPIVVPFSFFVTDNVYDAMVTEFGAANISREMAVAIFSGNVANWSDFGAAFPDADLVLCMRHAGSGTHATLDLGVMAGNGWGDSLVKTEQSENYSPLPPMLPTPKPYTYFNDGSTDLATCIQLHDGAIGYADSDKVDGKNADGEEFDNVNRVMYNGYEGIRSNIRDGLYSFWAAQHLYLDPSVPNYANVQPVVQGLDAFASNAANIALLGSKATYWATQGEMTVSKINDYSFPKK